MSTYSVDVFLKAGLQETEKVWELEGQLCPTKDS